jgi:hypothetical protein
MVTSVGLLRDLRNDDTLTQGYPTRGTSGCVNAARVHICIIIIIIILL